MRSYMTPHALIKSWGEDSIEASRAQLESADDDGSSVADL